MSFRVQQLLRAALGLGSRTSNCAGIAALVELRAASNGAVPALLGACTRPTAAPSTGGSAAVASLVQLQRALHTGLPCAAAAAAAAESEAEAAALNPLQQAPPPAAARAALGDYYPDEEPLRAKALLRNVAISPRKLNMFAKVVRGLSLEDALIQCQVSCKKSAGILRNVLMSAKANAVNNHGMDADKLAVEHAYVGSGTHLKRTSVHGRGRSGSRLRYRSHLTVILLEKEGLRRRTKVLPMLAERWYGIQERKLGLAPPRKGQLQHGE